MSSSELRKGVGVFGVTGILAYGLEFLKSIILASFFGITSQADYYYSGKSIPDLISSLVGTSAYSAILPSYSTTDQHDKNISILVSSLFSLGTIGLVFFVIAFIFGEEIIGLFFPGLNDEGITITTSIMIAFFVAGIFRIVSNVLRSYYDVNFLFILPASLELFLPVLSIISIILLANQIGIFSAVLGHVIAAIIVAIILMIYLIRKFTINFKFSINFGIMKGILLLIVPLALGSLAYRINIVIDRMFASNLEVGSISALQYGFNIINIFHIITVIPVTTALFPLIAKKVRSGDYKEVHRLSQKTLHILMPFSIWGVWFLIFYRFEIVSLLYGRGAFENLAIELTSTALFFYAFSLFIFPANSLFIRVLMSLKFQLALYTLGICSIIINFFGDWILGYYFQLSGIALATTIVQIAWFILAYYWVSIKIGNLFHKQDILFFSAMIISSFFLVFLSKRVGEWLVQVIGSEWQIWFSHLVIIIIGTNVSLFLYYIVIRKIGAPESDFLLREGRYYYSVIRNKVINREFPN